ncbi:uncharacterized protein MAM_02379 [Metarhizium album ARSEF 1941]|uniref:Uncharacterized protein n=1 Tax=Metarhizium album (strain ARSEF 1941) TaxID=1081103 RepID=A0A0B2WTX3_METAS|nr:uncharacterized protein MAM_02379 [Metarhizium album ARSEF 1941]KHN99526.1 hypothetical protein MAM_02379 [Metarhizium album ARSEF 1941]
MYIAVRAVFSETDNTELNSILNSIQEKIILPAYLPEKQRKLVFDPKKRSQLEQNPIIIEVEGLEHKFSSIDRFKEVENSKKALSRALHKMQSAQDWANLGTLLAGYKKAGIKLKANHWGKVVRVAGRRGHIFAVIECAKQFDKTGLVIRTPETAVRVLAFANDKITESAWDAGETKRALRWVETVLDLLQRPEFRSTRQNLHFSRLVRGLAVFSRASAVKVGQAAERDMALLRDEVALLSALWEGAVDKDLFGVSEFAKLNPLVERRARDDGEKIIPQALNGSAYIQVLTQNIKGIELAQEVLGDDVESLPPILDTLRSHLQDFATKSETRTEAWADEYEKVMGTTPNWPAAAAQAAGA